MKLLMMIIAMISPVMALSAEQNICRNDKKGFPVIDGGRILCQISESITETEGRTLADKTGGLVQSISFNSDIQFDLVPTTPQDIIGLERLEIQEQTFQATVALLQGPSLNVTIGVQPTLYLEGNDICSLKPTDFVVEVTRFESSLEDWLDNIIKDFFNGENLFEEQLKSLQEEILSFQGVNCQDYEAPVLVNEPWQNHDRFQEKLVAKYFTYLKLSQATLDDKGWITDTHCDGLLFNSLRSVAGGQADLSLAEDPQVAVRFYRHWEQDCYQNYLKDLGNSSASTISHDMMIGFFHWVLSANRPDLIENLINYGKSRSIQGLPLIWAVGDGHVGRAEMTPGLIQNAYDVREFLTGEESPLSAVNFQLWSDCNGYPCHLQNLGAFLRWRLDGKVSGRALTSLEKIADREVHNAIYNGIYGQLAISQEHMERAYVSLLNPQWFPDGRLPNNYDRSSDYIFQRDYYRDGGVNDDWLPETHGPIEEFSGTDFLFAAAVVLGVAHGGDEVRYSLAVDYLKDNLRGIDGLLREKLIQDQLGAIRANKNPVDLLQVILSDLANGAIKLVWGAEGRDDLNSLAVAFLQDGHSLQELETYLREIAVNEILAALGHQLEEDELARYVELLESMSLAEVKQDIHRSIVIDVFLSILGQEPNEAQLVWGLDLLADGASVQDLRDSLQAESVAKIVELNETIAWTDAQLGTFQMAGFTVIEDSCGIAKVDFKNILKLDLSAAQFETTITSCSLTLEGSAEKLTAKIYVLQRQPEQDHVVISGKETVVPMHRKLSAVKLVEPTEVVAQMELTADGDLARIVAASVDSIAKLTYDFSEATGLEGNGIVYVLPAIEETAEQL